MSSQVGGKEARSPKAEGSAVMKESKDGPKALGRPDGMCLATERSPLRSGFFRSPWAEE